MYVTKYLFTKLMVQNVIHFLVTEAFRRGIIQLALTQNFPRN